MHRRAILTSALALPLLAEPLHARTRPRIMTVRGWRDAADMGTTLVHEHALANFQPVDEQATKPIRYDRDEVVGVVLPRLQRLRARGLRTFVDATAAGLGRDPMLLRRLSIESGLNILTVTGNYAAFDYRFFPRDIADLTPDALAARWIAEWDHGIADTGIRPGFIKLGFNGGPLSPREQLLIRAAAIAHRRTGLTIGAHTGPAVAAFEQLAVLDEAGIDPSAWIWIHAQNEPNVAHHIAAARRGAWIEFDGIDEKTLDQHLALVARMKAEGLLNRVLISQDAGWYTVGEPGGGTARSYEVVFDRFLPALRGKGFTAADIDTLLVRNPARAFVVAIRTRRI
jgi:phosphotriesterase-related protein